jgi:hypothetical protein
MEPAGLLTLDDFIFSNRDHPALAIQLAGNYGI